MNFSQLKLCTVLCFLAFNSWAEDSAEQRDITVQHVVKAGENLHKITRNYLGTDILWQDNWKLNPHIENPNNLKIGQVLTIIKERIIPAEKAKVFNVVNRVEKKPSDGDWLSAQNGDELVQQEGVRTYAKSSALLEFNDESQLKVLEFSQIFLQSRETGLTGTDSATIEIVKGDAELNWEPIKADNTEITIVTGGTISKLKVEAGRVAELRTGLTESGNSVISVYQGNSEVESAGAQVNVKQGMGLAVKPGQVPPKPKPLLKAPVISTAMPASYTYTNPWLKWADVNGAAAYLVELCADIACQQVLKQQKVTSTDWQVTDFVRAGDYYFRVGAVSEDEIVGFRSTAHALIFTQAQEDQSAPMIAIDIDGHRAYDNGQLIVGPDATITMHAFDVMAGLKSIEFHWGDEQWQTYDGTVIKIPNSDSQLTIKAIDKLNQSAKKLYQFSSH